MNPVHLMRFEREVDGDRQDVAIAFMASIELDLAALNASVTSEIERALAPDHLVIVVGTSSADATMAAFAGRDLDALTSRLGARTQISVIGYDHRGQEVFRRNRAGAAEPLAIGLEEILRRGATMMFRTHGGFMEPNANYHFAGPSGRHTARFMRLSNILVRQAEIAFLALAVMRLIPENARCAYIDTPALYAVVSAVNEQWRALNPTRRPLIADNFRSYEGLDAYPFADYDESVVLISASSSGGLAGRLTKRGFAADRIVHVLFHGKIGAVSRVAINLQEDTHENPMGYPADREVYPGDACKLCDRGSISIPLKGDQFDIQGPQPEPLLVKRDDRPSNLVGLARRLAGTRALTISSGARQYTVDPVSLMSAPEFLKRLDLFVRRYVPGGIRHCILADEGSRAMAQRIADVNGSTMAFYSREKLQEMKRPIDAPDPVLVVAATIGSGRTLLEISRDLRDICPKVPIIYLVGFAKIPSAEHKERLRRTLVQSHNDVQHMFEVVEELPIASLTLPNPWQDELRFLQSSFDDWPNAYRDMLQARTDRLITASEPMVDELFVANDGAATLILQTGFAFWSPDIAASSQADVFYTISAVMQNLRTAPMSAGTQALRTNWLQQTLLSPENFGRFNDGVIQASILRAARTAELDYRDDKDLSATICRIVRRIFEASERPRGEAAAEFLISLGCRRLQLRAEDTSVLLRGLPELPPMAEALKALTIQELRITEH